MIWTINRVLGASGIIVALLLAGLLATRAQLHFARNDVEKWRTSYAREEAAHKQTVINYRTAALEAEANDALNKARVEAEQSTANDKVAQDYEERISDIRARFALLVRKNTGAETDSGSSQRAPVSGVPDATTKSDESAKTDALPAEVKTVQMDLEERRDAEEQAAQLIGLQEWVKKQSSIEREGVKE